MCSPSKEMDVSKLSLIVPVIIIILVIIFIVQRVRWVQSQLQETEKKLEKTEKKFMETLDQIEHLLAPKGPAGTVTTSTTCVESECPVIAPHQPKHVVKQSISSEAELTELLKTVDAIQDKSFNNAKSEPVPTEATKSTSTKEEKQLKSFLKSKGLSVRGTLDELRLRAKPHQEDSVEAVVSDV